MNYSVSFSVVNFASKSIFAYSAIMFSESIVDYNELYNSKWRVNVFLRLFDTLDVKIGDNIKLC